MPTYFWFELLSFLVSLSVFKKLKGSFLVYFVVFLFIVVLFESIGVYIKYFQHKNTGWLYNIFTIIQFPFWIKLFNRSINKIIIKKIATLLLFSFLTFALANLFFIQGIKNFNNYTLILGSIIIIFLSCYYFYELLNKDDIISPLVLPMFWIGSGALFYFTGTFLYFAFYAYIRKVQIEKGTEIFDLLNLTLIFVLYISITVGLLLTKPKKI